MENLIAKNEDEYVSKAMNYQIILKIFRFKKIYFSGCSKTPLFNQEKFSENFFQALEEIIN